MDGKAASIVVRLRRVTTEVGYVSVPVADLLIQPSAGPPGRGSIDTAKLADVARELGHNPSVLWELETAPVVEVHPIQKPPDKSVGAR